MQYAYTIQIFSNMFEWSYSSIKPYDSLLFSQNNIHIIICTIKTVKTIISIKFIERV